MLERYGLKVSAHRGPLDRGQRISTLHLLSAVESFGPHWPAAMSDFVLEAVSIAVGREISAGNLADGVTLTSQGRETLARLRGSGPECAGTLQVRRDGLCADHVDGCWSIICSCGELTATHIADDELEARVNDALSEHQRPHDPTRAATISLLAVHEQVRDPAEAAT